MAATYSGAARACLRRRPFNSGRCFITGVMRSVSALIALVPLLA